MTKFENLKKFILRKKTFRFRDVNEHFDQQPNSLNSYTTYLNTLRRAGLVKQTGRGQYKVLNAKKLRAASSTEISNSLLVKKLEDQLFEVKKDLRHEESESLFLLRTNEELTTSRVYFSDKCLRLEEDLKTQCAEIARLKIDIERKEDYIAVIEERDHERWINVTARFIHRISRYVRRWA